MAKNELAIRSSAAEFLIFEEQSHADGVEVIYQDGTLWMSQRMMGLLFDAAEIIYTHAASTKNHMGLSTWRKAPDGKILKSDVAIAKNYLSKEELDDLSLIVNAILDFAEARAKRHIPMTMQDWAERMEKYLLSDDRDIR